MQYMCKVWSTTQINFQSTISDQDSDINFLFLKNKINQSIMTIQLPICDAQLKKTHPVNLTYKSNTQSRYLQKIKENFTF